MKNQIKILKIFWDPSTPSGGLPTVIGLTWLFVFIYQIAARQYLIPLFGHSVTLSYLAKGESVHLAAVAGVTTAISYFSAISAASGSMLGFLITAATIFLTLPVEGLYKRFAENNLLVKLFELFILAIFTNALTLIMSLVATFTRQGIKAFAFEYVTQIATLVCLSYSIGFLLQCIHVLYDLGSGFLTQIQEQVQHAKAAKLAKIHSNTGPKGTV